jgi:hypothetical protein
MVKSSKMTDFLIKLRRLSLDDERVIVNADIVNYKAVRVFDPKAYKLTLFPLKYETFGLD